MTRRNLKKEEKLISTDRLLDIARKDVDTILNEFNTSFDGLDETLVEDIRDNYGENTIDHDEKESIFKRLVEAFINPFTIVLLVLSVISFITDVLIAAPGDKDYTAVIIVLTMVTISGVLRFMQEMRSGNEAEKLKAMVKITANIERKGMGAKEIPLSEVVVGDIVHLSAGDMIPADVRIIKAKDLFISQSALNR